MSGVELAEDICSRLDDILIEESPMHPFGCATWEESSRIAIDMAKDFIRRAVPMEAEAWQERVARLMDAEFAKDWRTWSDERARLLLGVGQRLDAFMDVRQALAVIPAPGNKEEKQ